jgi:hypothetical protein
VKTWFQTLLSNATCTATYRDPEAQHTLRDMVGTYPKCHAQMLVKVPKIPPKYPKCHAQMLAKVPKIPPKYPK